MPLTATQHTADGAKAFAEFFIKTIDWGYATTSSTYMRHYFGKSCIGCNSTARALDKARRQQHHFIGDRLILRAAQIKSSDAVHSQLLATFDVTSAEVVDRNDKYVHAVPALIDYRELLTLAWSSDQWSVGEFAAQP